MHRLQQGDDAVLARIIRAKRTALVTAGVAVVVALAVWSWAGQGLFPFRAALTSGQEAIVVRIYGPKPDVLRGKAEEVRRVLSGLDGMADVMVGGAPPPRDTVTERGANSRHLDVVAKVRGRDLGSMAREVERRLQEVQFPPAYHPEVLRDYAERQAAQRRMLAYLLVAAIGIYLLLQASFAAWRLATLAFLTVPMALGGGVLAMVADGGVLSLGSLVGFLAVFGIAALGGRLLISHYQHLERYENEPFGAGLVWRGTRERSAPILMTATAIGLAVAPVALVGDIAGREILHPMAVVILGGLVTSTLLSLFMLPLLYLRFATVSFRAQAPGNRTGQLAGSRDTLNSPGEGESHATE